MTAGLSHHDRALLDAVERVDVIDAAGRTIANPWRAKLSLAEQLAMAIAIERTQAALIEARLLMSALELPETGNDQAVKDHAIQMQTHRLRAELAALDRQAKPQEEKNHGEG